MWRVKRRKISNLEEELSYIKENNSEILFELEKLKLEKENVNFHTITFYIIK